MTTDFDGMPIELVKGKEYVLCVDFMYWSPGHIFLCLKVPYGPGLEPLPRDKLGLCSKRGKKLWDEVPLNVVRLATDADLAAYELYWENDE